MEEYIPWIILGCVVAVEEIWHKFRIKRLRKKILRGMLLDPRWEWRSTEILQRVIASDQNETIELLLEIGAKRNEKDNDVWTLND
jgi:hypothetical protein